MNAFFGGGVTYHSLTNAGLGAPALFRMKHFALLDPRAGVEAPDGRWNASLWAHNITNSYYWDNSHGRTTPHTVMPGCLRHTASASASSSR